jgi:glycosyltransferase involved in cell wall biosynthesis
LAKGEYILPVDADDMISPGYMREAAKILTGNDKIKVVSCEVELFGQKSGIKHYPDFSYRLLAQRNMIVCSSMFRRTDWEKCGGFCEKEIFIEDWDFWISIFKTGGYFYRLPIVGFKYRITGNSRRLSAHTRKKEIVAAINSRHPAFLNRQLGGKLHYNKTWSRFLNFFCRILKSEKLIVEPEFLEMEETLYKICGEEKTSPQKIIIQNREIIIDMFDIRGFLPKIRYGFFKQSQARKFYKDAKKRQGEDAESPTPVGYYEKYSYGLLTKSCYIHY